MTDPFEDGWGDLAAELGVETPKPVKADIPPPLPVEEPAPLDLSISLFDINALPDAVEPGSDTVVLEAPESPDSAEADAERKRRRRRRRKKKGDAIGEAAEGEPSEAEAPERRVSVDESITQPSELLKDIVKNWDVPGWDEIIGGLYRPQR